MSGYLTPVPLGVRISTGLVMTKVMVSDIGTIMSEDIYRLIDQRQAV